MLQQRCAGVYAHAHTYIYGSARSRVTPRHGHSLADQYTPTPPPKRCTCARTHAHKANHGNITDRPHHQTRKYLQQQQQYYTVGCYYAGWLPIDKRNNPHPHYSFDIPTGKPFLINEGISLERNHSPDVAQRLLEQLCLQDVLRRRESPVEMW